MMVTLQQKNNQLNVSDLAPGDLLHDISAKSISLVVYCSDITKTRSSQLRHIEIFCVKNNCFFRYFWGKETLLKELAYDIIT